MRRHSVGLLFVSSVLLLCCATGSFAEDKALNVVKPDATSANDPNTLQLDPSQSRKLNQLLNLGGTRCKIPDLQRQSTGLLEIVGDLLNSVLGAVGDLLGTNGVKVGDRVPVVCLNDPARTVRFATCLSNGRFAVPACPRTVLVCPAGFYSVLGGVCVRGCPSSDLNNRLNLSPSIFAIGGVPALGKQNSAVPLACVGPSVTATLVEGRAVCGTNGQYSITPPTCQCAFGFALDSNGLCSPVPVPVGAPQAQPTAGLCVAASFNLALDLFSSSSGLAASAVPPRTALAAGDTVTVRCAGPGALSSGGRAVCQPDGSFTVSCRCNTAQGFQQDGTGACISIRLGASLSINRRPPPPRRMFTPMNG